MSRTPRRYALSPDVLLSAHGTTIKRVRQHAAECKFPQPLHCKRANYPEQSNLQIVDPSETREEVLARVQDTLDALKLQEKLNSSPLFKAPDAGIARPRNAGNRPSTLHRHRLGEPQVTSPCDTHTSVEKQNEGPPRQRDGPRKRAQQKSHVSKGRRHDEEGSQGHTKTREDDVTSKSLDSTIGHIYTLPPSGVLPDPRKKVYCTYWIRTGECGYVQQKCKYKHEIPDIRTLHTIGFREVPRWWKEEQARERRRRLMDARVPSIPGQKNEQAPHLRHYGERIDGGLRGDGTFSSTDGSSVSSMDTAVHVPARTPAMPQRPHEPDGPAFTVRSGSATVTEQSGTLTPMAYAVRPTPTVSSSVSASSSDDLSPQSNGEEDLLGFDYPCLQPSRPRCTSNGNATWKPQCNGIRIRSESTTSCHDDQPITKQWTKRLPSTAFSRSAGREAIEIPTTFIGQDETPHSSVRGFCAGIGRGLEASRYATSHV